MNTLKYVGKCIGKACKLQTSEFSDLYEDLREASTLGPNTQTRKNKLHNIDTKLQTLARTRSKKTNLAKVNTLRLAHNILNAQRSNAVFESANFRKRIKSLKNRKNKHETEQLVEQLVVEEMKPLQARYNAAMKPVRELHKKAEQENYIRKLKLETEQEKEKKKQETKKTTEVIMKQYPMLNINNPKDYALLNHFVNTRLSVLKIIGAEIGDTSLTEDKVARDLFTSAAVEKLFTEIIRDQMAEKNTGRIVKMQLPPTSTIPVVSQQQQQQNIKKGRKTRKMNNRR